jgi:hypothetical protein
VRLFRRFNYRVRRADEAGAIFERAREVVRGLRKTEQPMLFLVEDNVAISEGCVSGTMRMKRQYPDLEQYEFTRERKPAYGRDTYTWKALSNVPGSWPESNPNGRHGEVDAQVLADLLSGVPKRFPVFEVALMLDRIDWLGTGREPAEWTTRYPASGWWWDDYLSPSVSVRRVADSRGGEKWLEATVEIEPPAETETALPPLPTTTQDALTRLGDVATEETIAAPSDEEREALGPVTAEAERLVGEVKRGFEGSTWTGILSGLNLVPPRPFPGVRLPHKLGKYEHVAPGEMSFKPTLVDALEPRGFTYVSALGANNAYVFAKRTVAQHRIRLCLSTGVRREVLRCDFTYEGPFFRFTFELYCSAWQLQGEYPVRNQDVLTKATANYAAVVDHLEETLVPALAGLYGSAPAWFRYEGDE